MPEGALPEAARAFLQKCALFPLGCALCPVPLGRAVVVRSPDVRKNANKCMILFQLMKRGRDGMTMDGVHGEVNGPMTW